jgi:hypothetical protein
MQCRLQQVETLAAESAAWCSSTVLSVNGAGHGTVIAMQQHVVTTLNQRFRSVPDTAGPVGTGCSCCIRRSSETVSAPSSNTVAVQCIEKQPQWGQGIRLMRALLLKPASCSLRQAAELMPETTSDVVWQTGLLCLSSPLQEFDQISLCLDQSL